MNRVNELGPSVISEKKTSLLGGKSKSEKKKLINAKRSRIDFRLRDKSSREYHYNQKKRNTSGRECGSGERSRLGKGVQAKKRKRSTFKRQRQWVKSGNIELRRRSP